MPRKKPEPNLDLIEERSFRRLITWGQEGFKQHRIYLTILTLDGEPFLSVTSDTLRSRSLNSAIAILTEDTRYLRNIATQVTGQLEGVPHNTTILALTRAGKKDLNGLLTRSAERLGDGMALNDANLRFSAHGTIIPLPQTDHNTPSRQRNRSKLAGKLDGTTVHIRRHDGTRGFETHSRSEMQETLWAAKAGNRAKPTIINYDKNDSDTPHEALAQLDEAVEAALKDITALDPNSDLATNPELQAAFRQQHTKHLAALFIARLADESGEREL